MKTEFAVEYGELQSVLTNTPWVTVAPVQRTRKGKVVFTKTIDQIKTNAAIDTGFSTLGWQHHPAIVTKATSHLVADFKKNSVQVEVQFGNTARWYTDVFKFLLSYAADDIEVGVLVVPMQVAAARIDENVVYYERILRELPHAKMAITIPVLVIGVM